MRLDRDDPIALDDEVDVVRAVVVHAVDQPSGMHDETAVGIFRRQVRLSGTSCVAPSATFTSFRRSVAM